MTADIWWMQFLRPVADLLQAAMWPSVALVTYWSVKGPLLAHVPSMAQLEYRDVFEVYFAARLREGAQRQQGELGTVRELIAQEPGIGQDAARLVPSLTEAVCRYLLQVHSRPSTGNDHIVALSRHLDSLMVGTDLQHAQETIDHITR